ncbi:hypothetical protein OH77DRAFT_117292 [Trametes cingulata]|nr:hypothetical protein OH77DRAFT_117292 [Trametes cingulata]
MRVPVRGHKPPAPAAEARSHIQRAARAVRKRHRCARTALLSPARLEIIACRCAWARVCMRMPFNTLCGVTGQAVTGVEGFGLGRGCGCGFHLHASATYAFRYGPWMYGRRAATCVCHCPAECHTRTRILAYTHRKSPLRYKAALCVITSGRHSSPRSIQTQTYVPYRTAGGVATLRTCTLAS